MKEALRTALCSHTASTILYRDADLVRDLLGQQTFLAVAFKQILAKSPNAAQLDMLNAVLVALMEHGLTPSSISARLTYTGAPESFQGAVAAGLLGVGDNFVGSLSTCGALLTRIVEGAPGEAELIVTSLRSESRPIPGFGHHIHRPDDPRATALLNLARKKDIAGPFVDALNSLAGALDRYVGHHVAINATGAAAAVLGDIGVPPGAMRGFALISRAAGLVAHLLEEQQIAMGRGIWALVDSDASGIDRPEASNPGAAR